MSFDEAAKALANEFRKTDQDWQAIEQLFYHSHRHMHARVQKLHEQSPSIAIVLQEFPSKTCTI